MTCGLCGGLHLTGSRPANWKSAAAREYSHQHLHIPADSIVCQACRRDITRVLSDDTIVPRWNKPATETPACCVSDCHQLSHAMLQKATPEQLLQAFTALGLECGTHTPPPTPLCKEHYHAVYNAVYPTQYHCATCGVSLRHTKQRLCPEPALIEQHLKENTNFQGTLTLTSKVCFPCYRAHLFALKADREESHDNDLIAIMESLQDNIASAVTLTDLLQVAMQQVLIFVARELLEGNALLLPDISDKFCAIAASMSHHLDIEVSKLATPAHILSNICGCLQHHVQYTCKTKKYGTLLYRAGMADLTQTVARALWKLRQCHKAMKSSEHVQDESKEEAEEAEVRKHSQRVTMLDDLNVRASRHVNNYLHEHKKSTFEFVHVNIQDEVKKFDPQLWEAVCILTTSAWEKQHPSELALHTKMIRRFFILCAIMHCINEDFTIPLHTLITDIVDGQGGSALLIHILNRLGVCSSLESLNRYMQDKRANRENCINHALSPDSFTVISLDNVDFVHSYARIFKSSWHGTSIQAVQPLPSLSEASDNFDPESVKRKRPESSMPALSPKVKRPRTGTEFEKSCVLVPGPSNTPNMSNTCTTSGHVQVHVHKIEDFMQSPQEEEVLGEFKVALSTYVLGRAAVAHSHQNKSLINMQDYFVHLRPTHSETSSVHYLDILDAKSDNKDTLMSVLYELHREFIADSTSTHLIVEGDAKIYELIQSLKFEYGNALQWVVPFPGDWHTLLYITTR